MSVATDGQALSDHEDKDRLLLATNAYCEVFFVSNKCEGGV